MRSLPPPLTHKEDRDTHRPCTRTHTVTSRSRAGQHLVSQHSIGPCIRCCQRLEAEVSWASGPRRRCARRPVRADGQEFAARTQDTRRILPRQTRGRATHRRRRIPVRRQTPRRQTRGRAEQRHADRLADARCSALLRRAAPPRCFALLEAVPAPRSWLCSCAFFFFGCFFVQDDCSQKVKVGEGGVCRL